jgi:hypothetical protein
MLKTIKKAAMRLWCSLFRDIPGFFDDLQGEQDFLDEDT